MLILIGFIFGFFYRLAVCKDVLSVSMIFGIFLPLILFFPFFVIRAFGAGDVKLLMMTGIYFGINHNLRCIGLALLAAAMVGLVRLLIHRQIYTRFASLFGYIKELAGHLSSKTGKTPPYLAAGRKTEAAKIHFSLYVLIGATITEVLRLAGG